MCFIFWNLHLKVCRTTSIQISFDCQRSPCTLLNSSIDEASPAYRPIGIGKVDITLWSPEIFQMFCHKTWRREEPSALSKLVIRPVVEYLEDVSNTLRLTAGKSLPLSQYPWVSLLLVPPWSC